MSDCLSHSFVSQIKLYTTTAVIFLYRPSGLQMTRTDGVRYQQITRLHVCVSPCVCVLQLQVLQAEYLDAAAVLLFEVVIFCQQVSSAVTHLSTPYMQCSRYLIQLYKPFDFIYFFKVVWDPEHGTLSDCGLGFSNSRRSPLLCKSL